MSKRSVIRKIKVKTEDPNTFVDKDLGALAKNVLCNFPIYNTDGELTEEVEDISLLSELIDYRNRFRALDSTNSDFNTIIESIFDNINFVKETIPVYTVLYSNTVRKGYLVKSTQSIESINCQLKLYNKYLPICVIDNETEPYDIYYSILNGTNKIEVFATLQLSFGEVATSEVDDELVPEENEVYLKCTPYLDNVRYFQTDLETRNFTELEEEGISLGNRLTITQIKAVITSQ